MVTVAAWALAEERVAFCMIIGASLKVTFRSGRVNELGVVL